MLLFWVITPHKLVGRHQRLGRTYYCHLHGDKLVTRDAIENSLNLVMAHKCITLSVRLTRQTSTQ